MAFGLKNKNNPLERPRKTTAERSASGKQVFSYYNTGAKQRNAGPEAERAIKLDKPNRFRLVPTIIALAIILISVLFSLTISSRPSASTLNDQASPYRPLADYESAVEELIKSNPGNLTKLSLQTNEIEKKLMEKYPELQAAVLRLPVLGRKPSLIIDIKPPALLLATTSNVYVLDSSGVIISEAKYLPQEHRSNLLVVKDESGLPTEVGSHVLPTQTVDFMREAIRQLRDKDLHVSSLMLPQSANELDIKLDGLPYSIKTDVTGDPRLQLGSFLAVKENLEGEGITPAEYVDVRVEEKVFYK